MCSSSQNSICSIDHCQLRHTYLLWTQTAMNFGRSHHLLNAFYHQIYCFFIPLKKYIIMKCTCWFKCLATASNNWYAAVAVVKLWLTFSPSFVVLFCCSSSSFGGLGGGRGGAFLSLCFAESDRFCLYWLLISVEKESPENVDLLLLVVVIVGGGCFCFCCCCLF